MASRPLKTRIENQKHSRTTASEAKMTRKQGNSDAGSIFKAAWCSAVVCLRLSSPHSTLSMCHQRTLFFSKLRAMEGFYLFHQKPTGQEEEEGKGKKKKKKDCLGISTSPPRHPAQDQTTTSIFLSSDRRNSSVKKGKVNKRKNCDSWAGASLQYLKKSICATAWQPATCTVSCLGFCPTGRTKGSVWRCDCQFQILWRGGMSPCMQQTRASFQLSLLNDSQISHKSLQKGKRKLPGQRVFAETLKNPFYLPR